MENVLTLIGNPAGPVLREEVVDVAGAALYETGAEDVGQPDWLAADQVCDIGFNGVSPEVGYEAVHQYLQDEPFDIVAQPQAYRRKKLLVADMDSTIIAIECIDELADYAGRRAEVANITERAMRGEIDFSQSLHERAAMLAGLGKDLLEAAFTERLALNDGARELVHTMRANGAYTALVSGGFTFFTSRVRDLVGFDMDQANELLMRGDTLTGAVAEPVLDPHAKLAALQRLTKETGIREEESLAVGDGANDIPMIQAAGLGVAYHAKPLVAAAAKAHINHGDLTALLYVQGYTDADIVRPN
jgi:phosphoserine phosphatase